MRTLTVWRQDSRSLTPAPRAAVLNPLLLVVAAASVQLQSPPDTLVLFTGTPAGTYRALGDAIAEAVQVAGGGLVIRSELSSGSVENIRAVAAGDADLAIVQNDIAFFAERGVGPFSGAPLRELRSLIGLHSEDVLLIAREGAGIETASQLRPGHRVVVGEAGSGTIANAGVILSQLGFSMSAVDTLMRSPRRSLHLLRTDSADAVFLTAGVGPEFFEEVGANGGRIVPFPEELVTLLRERYPYFNEAEIQVGARTIPTLRIRSILISRAALSRERAEELVDGIVAGIERIRGSHPAAAQILPSTLTSGLSLVHHAGAERSLCKAGLEPCRQGFPLLILFSVMVALGMISLKWSQTARGVLQAGLPWVARRLVGPNGLTRQYRYVLIPVVVTTLMFSGAFGVQRAEARFARENNVPSEFDDIGLNESLVWLLVFTATGFEDDRFPQSLTGKLISAAMGALGIGGVLLFFGLVTSDHIVRRIRMGSRLDPLELQNHVVVAGWSARAPGVIRSLTDPKLGPRRQNVVVLADLPEDPVSRFGLDEHRVAFFRGLATDITNLEKVGIEWADTLVVLADDSVALEDRDGRSLMVLIQAEKRINAPGAGVARTHRLHTVVEVVKPTNRSAMQIAYADEIICGRELDEQVLVQSVLNPGVSSFLQEVLTVDERNEVIEVPVTESAGRDFAGLTFRAALERGLDMGALLVGVNRNGAPGAHGAEGGAVELMVNPVGDDAARPIAIGDSLLFIADSELTLAGAFGDPGGWQGAFRGRVD